MQIVVALPPNFDEIDAAFNVRGKPVVYCWGHVIHNPMGIEITPEIMAHEIEHSIRQGQDILGR